MFSLIYIALGMLIPIRRFVRTACLEMIAVSLIYLTSVSVFTPLLWLDPLGPLIKVIPTMVLALLAHSLLVNR